MAAVYICIIAGTRRLVRAPNKAAARHHVSRDSISVELPSPEELVMCGKADIRIETAGDERTDEQVRQEIKDSILKHSPAQQEAA